VAEVDVSLLIPFADDEDRIGRMVRRLAGHLTGQELRHEILAVDEHSGDNSVALLGLLAQIELPQLQILTAQPGRGFAAASARARGRVLWFCDVARHDAPLSPFARGYARLCDGQVDVILVEGRYALARRTRVAPVVESIVGREQRFERRLRRRALLADLRVESATGARERVDRAGETAHVFPPAAPVLAQRARLWRQVLDTYVRR
jgi:hypothetical protein